MKNTRIVTTMIKSRHDKCVSVRHYIQKLKEHTLAVFILGIICLLNVKQG